MLDDALIDAAIALGLGLMIGLEREHQSAVEAGGEAERQLGVRTFALLALLGWIAGVLGGWLPVVALLVGGALAVISLFREEEARGLTTAVAAVVTVLVGVLVEHQRSLAVTVGLATTILLISKPWFQLVVPKLRRMDLTATLQLLVILAIVLPLLPTEARDPWGVLSPRRIGFFVTLIAGINYVGYVGSRALGRRNSAGLTGVVGGLASSTAVTVAMAQEGSRSPAMVLPGQLAIFLANAVMFARVIVLTAVAGKGVALAAALPMGLMGACMLAAAAWKYWTLRKTEPAAPQPAELELKNPLALVPALKWGAFFTFILVAAAAAREWLGDRGVIATAALAGFADVDAITLAVSRQSVAGTLATDVAVLAVVVAVTSNTIIKGAIAWVAGGRAFGKDVARVFGVTLALGLAAAALV